MARPEELLEEQLILQMSSAQNPDVTFHDTGWLIEILIMAYKKNIPRNCFDGQYSEEFRCAKFREVFLGILGMLSGEEEKL